MIIQILLSFGFLFFVFLYLLNARLMSSLSIFILLAAGFGLMMVWVPEITNTIAHLVGVGRGADLITYCWVMIGLALFQIVFLKIRRLNQQMTEIVRENAIAQAEASQTTSHQGAVRSLPAKSI